MNSMRERVNQGASQAGTFLHKPLPAKAAATHTALPPAPAASHSVVIKKEPKIDTAKVSRSKRIRVAQEYVRTAGKENVVECRKRPDDVTDIYLDDVGTEALAVAYVEHIYSYLHQREKLRLSPTYMDEMSINIRMRAILMDWLVSVAYKFGMCQDTLFLAVDIVDRFLATPNLDVTKDELQLIGVTAIFIAGKFEEVYPPELDDYVYLADNSCTKEQILETEMAVTSALNFDFTRPSPVQFLRRNCKAAVATTEEYCTAKYIAELSILNIAFVEILPSLTAAAAMYLTILMCRPHERSSPWSNDMQYYSNHEEKDILPVAATLLEMVQNATKVKHQCIYKKYSNGRLCSVAKFASKAAESVTLPSMTP